MPAAVLRTKQHAVSVSDIRSILQPADPRDAAFTACKVAFTIGPSCQSVEKLQELLETGATCARIDLTWGSKEFHEKSLNNLQLAMKRSRRLCAVMIDTIGREVFVIRAYHYNDIGWPVHDEAYNIKRGEKLTFVSDPSKTTCKDLFVVNYPGFAGMCLAGDTIYVGRYLVCGADTASLYLKVLDVYDGQVVCEAMNDAELDGLLTVFHIERSGADDMVENAQNELPLLSECDVRVLQEWSQKYEIDFLSLSYVRNAQDVKDARAFLDSIGMKHTKIVAKIESKPAVLEFQRILSQADAIIVSRGNLGLDCPAEKMAVIQKNLISCCNMIGKPVILTRIVDTMAVNPRCTRAEATDVANAVLDGCDGFLLGAETLRGLYPIATVQTVLKICKQAEKVFDHQQHFDHLMKEALKAEETGQVLRVANFSEDEDEFMSQDASLPPSSLGNYQDRRRSGLGTPSTSVHDEMHSMARSRGMHYTPSTANLQETLTTMTHFGGLQGAPMMSAHSRQKAFTGSPLMSKLESIASSSVRAADKADASMIVVFSRSGATAQLVAKYRPPMPIVSLVVPNLVSDGLTWRLEGRHIARQGLLCRGLLPMLAAADPNGERVLSECLVATAAMGLLTPNDLVVCVEQEHESLGVKIVAVDGSGVGLKGYGTATTGHPSTPKQVAGVPGTAFARTPSLIPAKRTESAVQATLSALRTETSRADSGTSRMARLHS